MLTTITTKFGACQAHGWLAGWDMHARPLTLTFSARYYPRRALYLGLPVALVLRGGEAMSG